MLCFNVESLEFENCEKSIIMLSVVQVLVFSIKFDAN